MSKKKNSDKWQEFAEHQKAEVSDEPAFDVDADQGEAEAEVEADIKPQSVNTDALEQQLKSLEMKIGDYKDQAVRAQAEMKNVQRRAERDVEKAHKYGNEKILSDLLPVMDSLVRGLEGEAPTDPHAKGLHEGMGLTLDMLEKTLQKHGIVMIDPKQGEAFNPECHQAMTKQPSPDAAPDTILQTLQKGFELNGRVIRAAMVIVAG